MLNYSVLQRRREVGIRMAIGPTRGGIVRIVTLDVFLTIALCFGAARYVESLFYQVKATDADMIALPACAILLTALVASVPAVLRALRTDPTEILRGIETPMTEAALKVVAKLAGVAPVTGLSRLEWIRERRRSNQREDPRDHQGIGLHAEYSCGQSAPKEIE